MSGILYELSTTAGEVIESCTTAMEIAKIIGVRVNTVYNAELNNTPVHKKFRIRKIDKKLSLENDIGLLLEYDLARENLLNLMRR